MNDKSRNIDAPCGHSALQNLSNDEFLKNYYDLIKSYLNDDILDKTPSASTLNDVKMMAEEEFKSYYNSYPTCAVFAPGSLAISGKNRNLVETKSLSMAVQLVTVVVGKRNHNSKWCYVKTMSNEINGRRVFDIYLNTEALDMSTKETTWIKYVTATLQSFRARRAYIPGFKIVIASNVPMKCGLGSSSALVVALYTFLEAVTNTYSKNIIEKALACYLAEKLAAYPCKVHISDILTSVIGSKEKITLLDARSLDIKQYDCQQTDVEFIFIECKDEESPKSCIDTKQSKNLLTLLNTISRWRTHPSPESMIRLLFSEESIQMTKDIIDEDKRLEKMIDKIRAGRWKDLGKLMGENCRSTRKYPHDIEYIVNSLQSVEGVLGFSIIDHNYGASIVAMVRRSKIKNFVSFWNRTKIREKRYYVVKSSTGASTIYSYERRFNPAFNRKRISYPKFLKNYHLRNGNELQYFSRYETMRTLHMFIPYGTYFEC